MREITLQVEPDHSAPRVSRGYLDRIKSELGARYGDVALVISELVTNSVRHGSGTADIRVLVEAAEDLIRVEVSDRGPCFDKSQPRGDGMGLDIVEQIADDWGVRRDSSCTVWVEISRGD